MAELEQTAEAKKQRRKRKKANEKNAALGVAKFTFEVAAVFKGEPKRLMKQHGINNQQEVYQLLLMNLIAADFETQAKMLRCVTTPFVVSERYREHFTRGAWPHWLRIREMNQYDLLPLISIQHHKKLLISYLSCLGFWYWPEPEIKSPFHCFFRLRHHYQYSMIS